MFHHLERPVAGDISLLPTFGGSTCDDFADEDLIVLGDPYLCMHFAQNLEDGENPKSTTKPPQLIIGGSWTKVFCSSGADQETW